MGREIKDRLEAKDLADQLSKFVNTYSGSTRLKALVEEMFLDHRTLLQQKMQFAFKMLVKAAEMYDDGKVDMRNEYTFKLAKEVVEKFPELRQGVPLI